MQERHGDDGQVSSHRGRNVQGRQVYESAWIRYAGEPTTFGCSGAHIGVAHARTANFASVSA